MVRLDVTAFKYPHQRGQIAEESGSAIDVSGVRRADTCGVSFEMQSAVVFGFQWGGVGHATHHRFALANASHCRDRRKGSALKNLNGGPIKPSKNVTLGLLVETFEM